MIISTELWKVCFLLLGKEGMGVARLFPLITFEKLYMGDRETTDRMLCYK